MKNLYFIRHGESEANLQKIIAGHKDVPLTELGVSQAKEAGRKLKESGIKIDLIVSSPLKRAHDTAIEIAQNIDYIKNKILINEEAIERYRGKLEGQSVFLQDGMSDFDYAEYGAESEVDMQKRAKRLMKFINGRKEENILIVAHNQIGRALVMHTTGRNRDDIGRLSNAQVFKIDI